MDLLHFTFIGMMALMSLFSSDTNKYALTHLLKLKTLLLDRAQTYTPGVLSFLSLEGSDSKHTQSGEQNAE